MKAVGCLPQQLRNLLMIPVQLQSLAQEIPLRSTSLWATLLLLKPSFCPVSVLKSRARASPFYARWFIQFSIPYFSSRSKAACWLSTKCGGEIRHLPPPSARFPLRQRVEQAISTNNIRDDFSTIFVMEMSFAP